MADILDEDDDISCENDGDCTAEASIATIDEPSVRMLRSRLFSADEAYAHRNGTNGARHFRSTDSSEDERHFRMSPYRFRARVLTSSSSSSQHRHKCGSSYGRFASKMATPIAASNNERDCTASRIPFRPDALTGAA